MKGKKVVYERNNENFVQMSVNTRDNNYNNR